MTEPIRIGDRVQVYFGPKYEDREGWYAGRVFHIDPYSEHRSFYWVELDADVQKHLGIRQISIFNPKNIRKAE
jgi:hypothetical protein